MATKHPRSAAFLIAFCFLSACGEAPTWHKDGADEMALQSDLSACRRQAQTMYGAPSGGLGSSPMGPRFGPVEPSPADRTMQEAQVVGSCMRGKGYILKAAEKK